MEIETILMRQLASYLSLPIFLVGMDGNLLYYNPAAEELLGQRFEDAGEMRLKDLATIFEITGVDGALLQPDDVPIAVALHTNKPTHGMLRFRALDGTARTVEVTAFPLDGHGGRQLGAAAIFWERDP